MAGASSEALHTSTESTIMVKSRTYNAQDSGTARFYGITKRSAAPIPLTPYADIEGILTQPKLPDLSTLRDKG